MLPLRIRSSSVMSASSKLVTCGIVLCERAMLAAIVLRILRERLAADLAIGILLVEAFAGRLLARLSPRSPSRRPAFAHGRHHVFARDAASGARAANAMQIDAQLAGKAPHRGSGRRQAAVARSRRPPLARRRWRPAALA